MNRFLFVSCMAAVWVGCGTDPSLPPHPDHFTCASSDECPPDEPICGSVVFANGEVRRLCTTHCSDSSECFSRSGVVGVLERCVPVDSAGEIVESYDSAICIRDCDDQHPCPNEQDCLESDFFGTSLCAPRP